MIESGLDRRAVLGGLSASSAFLLMGNKGQSGALDTAYLNGRIWTGVKGLPLASALGTVGDRISCVGNGATRARIGKGTRVVDLQGAFVTPGFMDNHTHFSMGSQALVQVQLMPVKTRQQFVETIGAFARTMAKGKWMQGFGWDAERWGGELPSRHWIDVVTPDTPVFLFRTDGHIALANSLALKLAGITRDTPQPEGGTIDKDASGEPTGILRDNGVDAVVRAIPPLSHGEIDAAMRRGIELGLSRGLTQVHNTDTDWETFEATRRLRSHGETGLRFYSFAPLREWEKLARLVREEGRGDDWVRWGGCKGMADGALGSRTALMREHYSNDERNFGFALQSFDLFGEWVMGADKAGLQVTAHAIGDAAIDKVLDIFAATARANGPRDRRFRIEHAQHIALDAIPRFGKQGVIASVHPYHAIDDGRWAGKVLNPSQLKGSWATRSLLDTGAKVTFGSDWPVAPLDPLGGIEAAVLRRTTDGLQPGGFVPEQKITALEALTAYTVTNAYGGFQERKLGTIEPGKLADLTMLGENVLDCDPATIAATPVLRTVVGGRERFTGSGV